MKSKALIAFGIAGLTIGLNSCSVVNQHPAEKSIKFTGFVSSVNALEFLERQLPIAVETPGDTIMIPSFERIIENDGIFYALDRTILR